MTTIKAIGKELVLKADQNISLYPQQNIWISEGTKLIFEGTVPDNFEAKLQATSVTADRDIILPDSDGTIATQEWVNLQGFGGGGGSAITIQDEGSALSTAATTINFVGSGVVASGTGATKTITISSGSGIAEVSSDTTPQLGGDLDLNSNNVTGTGDITVTGTVTATDFVSSGSGTPTLTSLTDIKLQAGTGATDRVEVLQSPFKFSSFTTAQRDAKTSENGDMIYNTSTAQLEGYQNSSWSALSGGGGGSSYTNSDVDTHLNQSNTTSGHVLSWNGSDYSWVAQSGGGSSYSDTDVATYLGGNLDTHILPSANDTYDIGSASFKIRDLYVSDNSIHIGDNTLRTSGNNLLLNGEDVMDYANFKNKPTTLAGYGITDGGISNIVEDTTPQLGGDLATNSNKITFGLSAELQMYNTGTKSIITSATDDMYFQRTSDSVPAYFFEAINDGFAGPYLSLKHDTVSPSTIDFATIAHDGKNDAAEDIGYSSIQFTTRSITDGTESGKIIFNAIKFGTNKTLLTINPTNADVEIGDNGAVRISRGSTPLRPPGETGMIRYNTTTSSFEGYGDSAWGDITNLEHTFTMTANGSSDYVFASDSKFFTANTNDPVLYLRRGETYNFVNNSGGSHPFEIRASNGGSAYSTGVTNNGASSGNIVFTVPMGAPATLYYQCTSHSSMGNTINIV